MTVLSGEVTNVMCSPPLTLQDLCCLEANTHKTESLQKHQVAPYQPHSPSPECISVITKMCRELRSPTHVVVIVWPISVVYVDLWEILWAGLQECVPGRGCVRNAYAGKNKFHKSRAEDQGGLASAFGNPASAGVCWQQTCCCASEIITTHWSKLPCSLKSLCSLLFIVQVRLSHLIHNFSFTLSYNK